MGNYKQENQVTHKYDYKYTMVCMKCEKTYRSISGIDDVCTRCRGAIHAKNSPKQYGVWVKQDKTND